METNNNLEDAIKTLGNNEEIEVKVSKRRRAKTPPYLVIGNGKSTKDFKEDVVVDAFELIGKLSKQQLQIFLYFKKLVVERNLDYYNRGVLDENPNYIIIPSSSLDTEAVEIKSLIRTNGNGKKIEELQIVRKIKANRYMVNPYLLIPINNFSAASRKWEELKPVIPSSNSTFPSST